MLPANYKNLKSSAVYKIFFTLFYFLNVVVVIIIASIFVVNSVTKLSNNEFDHLIFTQRWLPSACHIFTEKCKSSNCCKMPPDYKVWSIHGFWPQYKNSFGPFFCNKSLHFNETLIDSLRPFLDEVWPNIEKKESSTSLWKHEWLKHGTCAAKLEKLSDEMKYFNTTLELFKTNNMNNILKELEIYPNGNEGVDIIEIFNGLKQILKKNPFLHCETGVKSEETYLAEIRLCYDLNFELIDCGVFNNSKLQNSLSHSVTNCPIDSKVKFPDSINLPQSNFQSNALKDLYKKLPYYQNLSELLKFVKFLIWISL